MSFSRPPAFDVDVTAMTSHGWGEAMYRGDRARPRARCSAGPVPAPPCSHDAEPRRLQARVGDRVRAIVVGGIASPFEEVVGRLASLDRRMAALKAAAARLEQELVAVRHDIDDSQTTPRGTHVVEEEP